MAITFSSSPGILAGDLVYERASSSLASPIAPGAQDTILLNWAKDPTRGNMLLLGLGSDQHDNSYYRWLVDGVELPISGASRVGTITNPFYFPTPIRVQSSVILMITNNNAVAYPNNGLDPASQVPYECAFIGKWE